jgi:hypothetical protein
MRLERGQRRSSVLHRPLQLKERERELARARMRARERARDAYCVLPCSELL